MPRRKSCPREPQPKNRHLDACERETVIQYDDASEVATVWCSNKPEIAKLKRRKGIKIVEENKYGTKFEINKKEIQIGTPTRVRRTASRETAK